MGRLRRSSEGDPEGEGDGETYESPGDCGNDGIGRAAMGGRLNDNPENGAGGVGVLGAVLGVAVVGVGLDFGVLGSRLITANDTVIPFSNFSGSIGLATADVLSRGLDRAESNTSLSRAAERSALSAEADAEVTRGPIVDLDNRSWRGVLS